MKQVRAAVVLLRHALVVWRAGQLRFRLETFGLYYPALPYTSPAWRFPWRNAVLLLRHARSYCRWVLEMEAIRCSGSAGWWEHQRPAVRERADDV